MTGFTTGEVMGDPNGPGYVPSAPFEGQDWFGLSKMLGRFEERQSAIYGVNDPESGQQIAPPEPTVDPAALQEKYGGNGLTFDSPLPESVAQQMFQAKQDEIDRNYAASRVGPGFGASAARFGAGFVAGALDPLNIAASFVPLVGPARYAGWLAEASGPLARAGIRAGVGAAEGAAGQAPLVALRYGLSKQEQADYTANDAMLDMLYGTALGGGLHVAGGVAHDLIGGAPHVSDPLAARFEASPEGHVVASDLDTREAAARTAIAQMADGRPIYVEPVLDAAVQAEKSSATESAGTPEGTAARVATPDAVDRPLDASVSESPNAAALKAVASPLDTAETLPAFRAAAGDPLPEQAALSSLADTAAKEPKTDPASLLEQQIASLRGEPPPTLAASGEGRSPVPGQTPAEANAVRVPATPIDPEVQVADHRAQQADGWSRALDAAGQCLLNNGAL